MIDSLEAVVRLSCRSASTENKIEKKNSKEQKAREEREKMKEFKMNKSKLTEDFIGRKRRAHTHWVKPTAEEMKRRAKNASRRHRARSRECSSAPVQLTKQSTPAKCVSRIRRKWHSFFAPFERISFSSDVHQPTLFRTKKKKHIKTTKISEKNDDLLCHVIMRTHKHKCVDKTQLKCLRLRDHRTDGETNAEKKFRQIDQNQMKSLNAFVTIGRFVLWFGLGNGMVFAAINAIVNRMDKQQATEEKTVEKMREREREEDEEKVLKQN